MSKASWQEKLFLSKTIKHKCKEFHESGYLTVTETDLWAYLQEYRWKHQVNQPLAEKKGDIGLIEFNEYFDYQRIKAQTKSPHEFDWDDMTDIL